ncbi:MAG TPA: PhnD/SsuA/transferrin family substrate-binding protein [Thiobacillus sp.]|nr:PhnD/SsuA/transferrin family substrate-binding protein [Thiobacillus sp.]
MPRHSPLPSALILGVLLSLPALSHGADYRLGIFAGSASKDNQAELKATFKPLVDYIAQASGANVKMEISQSFKNMDRHLGAGRYTIFLGPPHVTADAIEEGFEPVAKWDKPIFGVVVVPVDKPYKTIADLKGARMGIASRDTAAGPLCISALNKAGLRPDQDLAAVYEGKFQDVMVKQLSQNSLDAICIGPGPWRMMNEQEPGKYRIIGESARAPGFALSIDSELSDQEKKKLTAILVGIGKTPEGKRALDSITGSAGGATNTLPTNTKEYFSSNLLMQENKRLYNVQIPN